jgi:UDP-glucose 4-epimerase
MPSSSRRILIIGLSSHWGGRLAQALEPDPAVETIVGVDLEDPRHPLERTEFVRLGDDEDLLRRILDAAEIDTVIDTRLPGEASGALAGAEHTERLLAACAGRPALRKLIFRSSDRYYGAEPDAPAFLGEGVAPAHPARTALEAEVRAAEAAVAGFARANPALTVTVLRFAPAVGAEARSAHLRLLGLPVVPSILGLDPRWQLIHEEDVTGALVHAARAQLPGAFNAAADGVLALSEIASLLGKTLLPVLPPWGTVFAAVQLRRLGLPVPVELLRDLRFGRGLENRRLKASGFQYRYTTREAVIKLRAQQRLRPLLRSGADAYRYEREVEEFLRWSPSVRQPSEQGAADGREEVAASGFDALSEGELADLIPSLERDGLEALCEYERTHRARAGVLEMLARQLERRGA